MPNTHDKKLWSGRFSENTAELLEKFNSSLNFDKRLYRQDIACSIVHSKILSPFKIILNEEKDEIIRGLNKILEEIEIEKDEWFENNKSEDIHSAIENRLVALIGETGKKLHTGRSRNDQVACDIRLWLREEVKIVIELLQNLRSAFINLARTHHSLILPGYTHLQHAQPITLGHYFLAYEQKLSRDIERFKENL